MTPWQFLFFGYAWSVMVEGSVLLFGLSPRHSLGVKLFASFWLTACTYPIVILALPALLPRASYVPVAEIFAAVAECALFAELLRGRWTWRDMIAIAGANVTSFLFGWAVFG